MPTYEYRCKDCGEHLEVVQSFTDDALTECPACGGSLRKVFGNIGITFRGSGFYKTDSRKAATSASKSSKGDSTPSESSSGDSSSSTSSDSSASTSTSSDGAGTAAGTGTSSSAPAKTA